VIKVSKTIKISEKSYNKLNAFAGSLRAKEGKPISIDKALSELFERSTKGKATDFAGSWSMSEEEAENIKNDLKRHWKTWKIK